MDWEALGKAVLARRVELGHESQGSFAEAADIAARTIGDIERGKRVSYRPSILARLERALRWPTGTVDAILQGLPAPEPMPPRPSSPILDGLQPIPPEVSMLLAALDAMTEEERAEQLKQVRWLADMAWHRVERRRDQG